MIHKTSEYNTKNFTQEKASSTPPEKIRHANRIVTYLTTENQFSLSFYQNYSFFNQLYTKPKKEFQQAIDETNSNNLVGREDKVPNALVLNNLPREVLMEILFGLDSVSDVDHCCLLNKNFNCLINSFRYLRPFVHYNDCHRGYIKNGIDTEIATFDRNNIYGWLCGFCSTVADEIKDAKIKKNPYFAELLFHATSTLLRKSTSLELKSVGTYLFRSQNGNPGKLTSSFFFNSPINDFTGLDHFHKFPMKESVIKSTSISADGKHILIFSNNKNKNESNQLEFWHYIKGEWRMLECKDPDEPSKSLLHEANKLMINPFGYKQTILDGVISRNGRCAVILFTSGKAVIYEFDGHNTWNKRVSIESDPEISYLNSCTALGFTQRDRSVAISPDGKHIVTTVTGVATVWESVDGRWKNQNHFMFYQNSHIRGNPKPSSFVSFNHNGKRIVTIQNNVENQFQSSLWKNNNNEWTIENIAEPRDKMISFSFSPDGNHAAAIFQSEFVRSSGDFFKRAMGMSSTNSIVNIPYICLFASSNKSLEPIAYVHLSSLGNEIQFSPDGTQIRVNFRSLFLDKIIDNDLQTWVISKEQ